MPSSTWRTAGRESCGAMRTPMEGRSKGMEWATKVWELKERPPSLVCFVHYLVTNPVHLKHIVWAEWTWRVTHFTHVISCYAKSVLWWSSYFPGLKSWLSHMRPPPEMAAFTVDARAHVTKETTSNAVLLTQRLQDDSGIVCWNGWWTHPEWKSMVFSVFRLLEWLKWWSLNSQVCMILVLNLG